MSAPSRTTHWPARHLLGGESSRIAQVANATRGLWSRLRSESAGTATPLREYGEVIAVIGAVTVVGWFVPMTYRAFGHVYLLAVIALSLRVGRWPVLVAAIVSAIAWNFVFMPPRLSFSVLHFEDSLMLGTYLTVALIAGQLTARIRAQEREERSRERRATALFHLTRALTEARTLDEAAASALRQADGLFEARSALVLEREGGFAAHAAGTLMLGETELAVARLAMHRGSAIGRLTEVFSHAEALHVPLLRAGKPLGVFSLALPPGLVAITSEQKDLIEGFASQIALLVEREQLRAAGEREKLFAESDRLHRTLLDSVSHELKTPLAVLRAAGEKLDTENLRVRASLTGEIRTATRRLDHLVANLLNQNRLESGVLRPQMDWCDVRDLINAARRAVGEALNGRPLQLELPANLPYFMADAPLMEQAIANLLLNACLHTPAGNQIRVAAGLERASGREQVFISVADRGGGISPELRGQLFQKFSRGERAKAGGLGLGLSIVRGFMLAQGGDVMVDDNPGGGARFTLFLPYRPHGFVPNDER